MKRKREQVEEYKELINPADLDRDKLNFNLATKISLAASFKNSPFSNIPIKYFIKDDGALHTLHRRHIIEIIRFQIQLQNSWKRCNQQIL
jgi:hypothetical protein